MSIPNFDLMYISLRLSQLLLDHSICEVTATNTTFTISYTVPLFPTGESKLAAISKQADEQGYTLKRVENTITVTRK